MPQDPQPYTLIQVIVHTMNPKAMPRQQLLGHMDLDTREWFDGVRAP